MKVSLSWLKELIKYDLSAQQLADLLSLKSIGVKQVTDNFIELDLTYNRGDLLSLRGVAREVAAITNSLPSFETNPAPKFNLPEVQVKVESPDLCPVYCVAKIENLKVEQSSGTWIKKLSDCGIRAVNSIADVTNLIMLEYGQPMHAFDYDKVKGQLSVRPGKKGEKLVTIDNKSRDISQEDLVIADEQKTIALAGVMGGKETEISDSTSAILLEAAIFDPILSRKTSKRHGLYSEATKRFQHGLTKTNLLQALSTAIKMYEDLGGKVTTITLTGDLKDKEKIITLNYEKLNNLIGVEIPKEKAVSSLKSLGFLVEGNQVIPPYFRLDINIEEDLIEEVARMYGYEKIAGIGLKDEEIPALEESLQKSIYSLQVKLKDLGLTEVQTYSFYSSKVINDLGLKINDLIKIANPISSETEYLRASLWPNLVEVVGKNLRQGYKDIAIFEIGKIYLPAGRQGQPGPKESYRLAVALMNNTDNPLEELISLVQSLSLHLEGVNLNPTSLFHPTRITENMAEVHLRVLNKLGIEKRVAILELKLLIYPLSTQT